MNEEGRVTTASAWVIEGLSDAIERVSLGMARRDDARPKAGN